MKGLTTDIILNKGAFSLTESTLKAKDEINFYLTFDKTRVYLSEFNINLLSLLQKPASYIRNNNTLILGLIKKGIESNVPNVKVNLLDVGFMVSDRKTLVLKVYYQYKNDNGSVLNDVIFI